MTLYTVINLGPESSRFYKAREGKIELISESKKCISIASSGRHGYMVSIFTLEGPCCLDVLSATYNYLIHLMLLPLIKPY